MMPFNSANAKSACPSRSVRTVDLPTDGTPLEPSPLFAVLRSQAPATPLRYPDGHVGWLVTGYELARDVLSDPRFSMLPHRFPSGSGTPDQPEVDAPALESIAQANLLALDEPQHAKIRRAVTGRLSARAVRGYRDFVNEVVQRQLHHLREQAPPADLTTQYAQPISAAMHCFVLGVPQSHTAEFTSLFVGTSTSQQKFDFIREVLDLKKEDLGEDVISDLVRTSDLTRAEVEGILLVLMTSGRDSVAYLIATAVTALLTHPEQLATLRDNPELITGAVEEFVRFGSMFVTVFPRTATEDSSLDGIDIKAGQTVSVSQVSANRDNQRFDRAEHFDVTRDAFGHLGFGYGAHGCVGQQLARLEVAEAVRQLVAEFPTLYLVEAEQSAPMPFAHDVATYEAGSVVIGWQ